jgi:hypothetical protein
VSTFGIIGGHFLMTPLRLYSSLLGTLVVLGLGALYWAHSRQKTPEQREAERRRWLSATGRIIDGQVLDARELARQGSGPMQLLIYNYDVGGVGYECSQDITSLKDRVDLEDCRLGMVASIKYDPRNPGNSILVAENWSGLRH